MGGAMRGSGDVERSTAAKRAGVWSRAAIERTAMLAVVTDTVEPTPELERARALLADVPHVTTSSPWAGALRAAGLGVEGDWSRYFDAGAEPTAEPAPIAAVRRDAPFRLPVDVGLPGLVASAVRPHATLGPFEGVSGRYWIDVFSQVDAYGLFEPGAARPILVLTQARLPPIGPVPPTTPYTVEIDGGTVWIAAAALDAAAAPTDYVGLTVSGGKLVLSAAPSVSGTRLTATGALEGALDVTPAAAPSPAEAGDCPARASVKPPSTLRLSWSAGGGPTVRLGPASAGFSGQAFDLKGFGGPSLDSEMSAIVFPGGPRPAKLDVASLSSEVVQLAGAGRVTGGWGLTLTRPSDPEHPGEAIDAGFAVLRPQQPLQASWLGSPAPAELPHAFLTVRDGQLALVCKHASLPLGSVQTVPLYAPRAGVSDAASRLPLHLRCGEDFAFGYVCDREDGEALYATCMAELRLDRPVDMSGRPLAIGHVPVALLSIARASAQLTVSVKGLTQVVSDQAQLTHRRAIAVRNALLAVSEPALLQLQGSLSPEGAVDAGTLRLTLAAYGWLPTLPDPYVTNFAPGSRRAFAADSQPDVITADTWWDEPTAPMMSFRGRLRRPNAVVEGSAPGAPRAPRREDPQVPTQSQQGSQLGDALDTRTPLRSAATTAATTTGASTSGTLQAQEAALERLARESVPLFGDGLRLLDVSTNMDLLGVELEPSDASHNYALSGLDVCLPGSSLSVFMLPQVMWEPVRTLDVDQDIANLGYFPSPLASATDGGPTALGVQSARLVPAIPDVAVDAALAAFENGARLGVLTTLPFGIKALLRLRPVPAPDGRGRDGIARNEPTFDALGLRGGAQLALVAESGPSGREQSSSFDGVALQLLNGVSLATGAPLNLDVLASTASPPDSVDRFFNQQFGPGSPVARVPVTRLDLSGYGGSTFSDWVDTRAAFAEAAKAQFHVVVGRAALEVVKIATVLHPWGIMLTRSITIERRGGGGLIRRDSGWQASSDGLFQVPATGAPGTPYVVEPGLLRGLFKIRDVRPTGGAPVRFTGANGDAVVLVPKFFDADVRIDGLEGADHVVGHGLLGFLQLSPRGAPPHVLDLARLIVQQGPIGGPVDGVVAIGDSGFRMRATRVEVGIGAHDGQPELVGTVRGAPVFRQDGAWSAIRLPGPGNPHGDGDAVGVDQVRGLPVVREGVLLGAAGDQLQLGPVGEYRFADAIDLHEPDAPQFEYGLAQTSPAHTFLFPRPHVEPGVAELRSRARPRFADLYARMTSKGAFPPAANAIELPANALVVDPASGSFRLRDAIDMSSPRPPLVLASNGSDVVQLDYGGARLTSDLSATQWSVELTGLALWTDLLGIPRFTGWSSDLVAGTGKHPLLQNLETLLGSAFADAVRFLGVLDSRPPLPPIDLSATNEVREVEISIAGDRHFSVLGDKVKIAIGVKGHFGWQHHPAATPTPEMPSAPTIETTGGALVTAEVEGHFGGPWFLVLGAAIEAGAKFGIADTADTSSSPGTVPPPVPPAGPLVFELEFKAYAGVGYGGTVFGLKAEASLSVGVDVAIEGSETKVAPLVVLKGEVTFSKALAVEVSGEFKGTFHDHPGGGTDCDWGGEIEINVELMFFGIHASVEIQGTSEVSPP
jgi:hypothetical protein